MRSSQTLGSSAASLHSKQSHHSTLSGAPSLSSSRPSLGHSRISVASSAKIVQPPEERVLTREEKIAEFLDKAKFYTSLCLGTTAILSVFAFLFLIPFVVDPAITTILADYEPEPVTCIVTDYNFGEGLRNCTWSSCREGCTTASIKCHQFLVNYSKIPFEEFMKEPKPNELVAWDIVDTKFFINTEGCGYPPSVNCTIFAKKFGGDQIGNPFPCYYSRQYPEQVVARFNASDNLKHLIFAIIVPNLLFAISIGVLSYWYCPCCDKACNKSRVYAEKYEAKEKSSNESWNIDYPEEDSHSSKI